MPRFTFRLVLLSIIVVAITPGRTVSDEPAKPNLPKIVLIGDSIRLSYAPTVVEQLAGKAVVVNPSANGGDSSNVLRHLDEWIIRERPAVVHINCGIHDTEKFKSTG